MRPVDDTDVCALISRLREPQRKAIELLVEALFESNSDPKGPPSKMDGPDSEPDAEPSSVS